MMRWFLAACGYAASGLFLVSPATAQTVLFNSGPFVTHTAANGASLSVRTTGLLATGYGLTTADGVRAADDFTIPPGQIWSVTAVQVFAFQTGSGTTSTLNGGTLRLFRGSPAVAGSPVVAGDTTTNRLTDSRFSGAYRVTSATSTDVTRPIMANTLSVGSLPVLLGEGTYWIDATLSGTLAGRVFAPSITLPGQLVTGNALQRAPQDGNYYPMVDAAAGQPQQGLPFTVIGTVVAVPELPVPVLMGVVALAMRKWRGK
jgi:hypothetical protein